MYDQPKFISDLIERKMSYADILDRVNKLHMWTERLLKATKPGTTEYVERGDLLALLSDARTWLKAKEME